MTNWGSISQLINCIEKWIGQYNITFTYVSGAKLIDYANREIEKYSVQDMIDCLVNK